MLVIEYKQLDYLRPGDWLLADAGVYCKAGRAVDERVLKLLEKHRVCFAPVFRSGGNGKNQDPGSASTAGGLEAQALEQAAGVCDGYRTRLLEKLKSLYLPFDEEARVFHAPGKKKQLVRDKLLSAALPSLYQPDIQAGSAELVRSHDLQFLTEILKAVFKQTDTLSYLGPETRAKSRRIRRLCLPDIRLHTLFNGSHIVSVGDALAWHVLDAALYFLFTAINMNKKRALSGAPLSTARFNPDQKVDETTKFQYYPGTLCDACLGILLHDLGFMHHRVHSRMSEARLAELEETERDSAAKLLRSSFHVLHHLLQNRSDISSIARMICFMQHEFPDGTGYPPENRNRYLHELLRLFQIVHFYDTATHPVFNQPPCSRQEVIDYMLEHSAPYVHHSEKFVARPRFDADLLAEFLQVLAPYSIGEKVILAGRGGRGPFIGRVVEYRDSYLPLISVVYDKGGNKVYPFNSLFFNLADSTALVVSGSGPNRKWKLNWIGKLKIIDLSRKAVGMDRYRDFVFGGARTAAKIRR